MIKIPWQIVLCIYQVISWELLYCGHHISHFLRMHKHPQSNYKYFSFLKLHKLIYIYIYICIL